VPSRGQKGGVLDPLGASGEEALGLSLARVYFQKAPRRSPRVMTNVLQSEKRLKRPAKSDGKTNKNATILFLFGFVCGIKLESVLLANCRPKTVENRVNPREETMENEEGINGEKHGGRGSLLNADCWAHGDILGDSTHEKRRKLAELLGKLGGTTSENLARIRRAVGLGMGDMESLTPESVLQEPIHLCEGDDEDQLWSDAGHALFQQHFPGVFQVWDSNPISGLWFEPVDFIEEYCHWTDLFEFDGRKVVVVAMHPPHDRPTDTSPRCHRRRLFVRD
jgi:hypothetical protein